MKLSITFIATSLALVGRATAGKNFKLQDKDPNPHFKIGECDKDFNWCSIGEYWIHIEFHKKGNGRVKKWEPTVAPRRCNANEPCKRNGDPCFYSFTQEYTACSKLPVLEPPVKVEPPNFPTKAAPKKPAKAAPKKPAKVAPKKPVKVAPKKPVKVAPKKPAKVAPKKPAKVAPKKPAKTAPKKARRNLRTEKRARRR